MGRAKITIEEFIDRAMLVHGNKYDYSLSIFSGNKIPIKIICKIHGIFEQKPEKHILEKHGCPECGGSRKSNNKNFIVKATSIHDHKYDYSLVEYHNAHTHVKIICKTHGEFEQAPTHHLNGRGCPQCFYDDSKVGLDQFIQRSNAIHNYKYDYSLAIYTRSDEKLKIICKMHGEFEQKPNAHMLGAGCPRCVHTTSKPEIAWLNSLNVNVSHTSIKIGNKLFKVDAFKPATNTVYEFYGDYWHGNPTKYLPHEINAISKKTFGELYQQTLLKEKILTNAGYKVISIWERDWKEQCRQQL
jgi:hypothetical protein